MSRKEMNYHNYLIINRGSEKTIYYQFHEYMLTKAQYNYDPQAWKSVGVVSFKGEVVAFDGPSEVLKAIKRWEPLVEGNTFSFPEIDGQIVI